MCTILYIKIIYIEWALFKPIYSLFDFNYLKFCKSLKICYHMTFFSCLTPTKKRYFFFTDIFLTIYEEFWYNVWDEMEVFFIIYPYISSQLIHSIKLLLSEYSKFIYFLISKQPRAVQKTAGGDMHKKRHIQRLF